MTKKVDTEEEIGLAVIRALSEWTQVEMGLAQLFEIVSGMDVKKAQILMATVISFETRLSICGALIADHDTYKNLQPLWKKLSKRLMGAYKSRHQIAHFITTHRPSNNGGGVSLSPYFSIGAIYLGRTTEIGVSEIDGKAARFREVNAALSWFQKQHMIKSFERPDWIASVPAEKLPELLKGLAKEPELIVSLKALIAEGSSKTVAAKATDDGTPASEFFSS